MNITYYKTLLLQFLPRIVKIGINLVLGTDTGQHNLYQPRTGSGPVFTNILILRIRIFLRIRKFSYLRIFLFLEKICIHKAILS